MVHNPNSPHSLTEASALVIAIKNRSDLFLVGFFVFSKIRGFSANQNRNPSPIQ
jgi:hypothetical protein